MAEALATPFAVRFSRAWDVATVTVVCAWHFGAAGVAVLAHFDRYSRSSVVAAAWLVQLAVIAWGSGLLLRRATVPWATWLLVIIDLGCGVAVIAATPGADLLRTDWALLTVGLVGALLLLHRPVRVLVALLAVNALIAATGLLVTGNADRHNISGLVAVLYGAAAAALALTAGARVFRLSGGMAAEAAAEQWEIATRASVIAEVADARQARYQAARDLAVPMLRELADGTLDPADPEVQHRCANVEAVLRQLLSERQDVPDPLLRALQHGIDDAARRGVVVEVVSPGELPDIPLEAGSMLAAVPLAVLATARGYARVSVLATGPGDVSVSVLSDGDEPVSPPRAAPGITVTLDRDHDLLWLEVRWQDR